MKIILGNELSNKLTGTIFDDYFLDNGGGNDSVFGLGGDDLLVSEDFDNHSSNLLNGGQGDDVIWSYRGEKNILLGGLGNDFLNSFHGQQNQLLGGEGNDTIKSQHETRTTLNGGQGNDSIYSLNNSSNRLLGGEGNDTLSSINNAATTLVGGNGDDYIYTKGGKNFINAGLGQDIVNSEGNDVLIGQYQKVKSPILLNIPDPNVGSGLIVGEGINTSFLSIESFKIWGGEFDDTLIAGNGDDTLNGGLGNDILNAQAGNNIIRGEAGNDLILSIEKAVIFGGTGNDIIVVRDGGFEINGNQNNDTIFILEGTGNVHGGVGIDLLGVNYKDWNSSIKMEYNQSTKSGYLEAGSRKITFNQIEQLEVFGSLANDNLIGTNSSDRFTGGQGIDTITGGMGSDIFRFVNTNSGVDIITDFNVTEDQIELISEGSPIFPLFPEIGFGEFAGVTIGSLLEEQFTIGSTARDSSDRLIYNSLTGDLFYDVDGVGNTEQVKFANLTPNLELTNNNFVVA